jgi:hypothetical protein
VEPKTRTMCVVYILQEKLKDQSKSKANDNFYIAHISIPRMLTALGVYIQMYRGHPCRGFEPRSPACQSAALTTRPNPRPWDHQRYWQNTEENPFLRRPDLFLFKSLIVSFIGWAIESPQLNLDAKTYRMSTRLRI